MPVLTPTTCRICESQCGLLASVEGARVLSLQPDPDHPLSQGYACIKGTRFAQVQHDPARITQPLLRQERGAPLRPVSWNVALGHIGSRLQSLRAQHGPESVGLFLGNAAGHSLGAILGATAFQRGIGTTKSYSSLTLDNSGMFVVTEAVFGNPMFTFLADYAHSDLVVLFGTDPLSSQPSQAQSNPGGHRELMDVARRGQLVVLDPRASTTARAASTHLALRPGSDAVLLAWLLRDVLRTGRWRSDPLLDPSDMEALTGALAGFDLEHATASAGLPASELTALRDRLLSSERPLVWSGLGVLLGPHGTLGYWLTAALQAALGGLDHPGGWIQQRGAVDLPRLTRRLGMRGSDPTLRSRVGGFAAVLGTLASATLADDILQPGKDRLRALVVVGGNPALSLPDARKAQRALRELELLVVSDLFVNDTGVLADVVLPATTWLERPELAIHLASQRRIPHLQLAPAVVPPVGDTRDDWRILLDLTRAAGALPFGSRVASACLRAGLGPIEIARALVSTLSPFQWSALRQAPRGKTVDTDPTGTLRRRGTDHPGGRVHLAVPEFLRALADLPRHQADAAGRFQLVTSVRPLETMNSWYHHKGAAARRTPVAVLHPLDLADLGVREGARLNLRPHGTSEWLVCVATKADAQQRRGTVVLPYGWGHLDGAVGAGAAPGGVNANLLVTGDGLDPFTGQPVSNGQWIEAAAAQTPGS